MAGLDKQAAKRRLFGFLKRRGFDLDVIMKVVREALED
jgi:SOS response regulatory protein OraA/RecX